MPLRQSEVSVLIAARRFRNADYVSMLRELKADRLPSLRTLVHLGEWHRARRAQLHDLARWATPSTPSRLREREAGLQFDDPANIQYTSGHHRRAEGSHALSSQHSEQRLF